MDRDSASRHVLVTGASRGIGAAIAAAFVAGGDRVTVLGRTAESAAAAKVTLGAAAAVSADVTDAAALEAALAAAAATGGPIEVLVNNAGGAETQPIARTDLAQLQRMMALNLEPVLTAVRAVLPGMKARAFGRIVTVASTAGLKGYAYAGAYCAAKHAVVGLTRALALEVATDGITVNAVCPGYADTDLVHAAVARLEERTGKSREALLGEFTRHNPMGRLVRPEEIAASVVWLAGNEASAVTGQAIAIAGGEL
ncbi:MAG TPA: SDR family oxidoreductase [Hyphomicrobiales bacterium]|nr:SDR family oxidoreductase [Hyphomicrobiales bacterium]